MQKAKKQKQEDDDVTSEESDAELWVHITVILLSMSLIIVELFFYKLLTKNSFHIVFLREDGYLLLFVICVTENLNNCCNWCWTCFWCHWNSEGNVKEKDIEEYSSSDDDETADQKRKRLAQEHLEKLKAYGQFMAFYNWVANTVSLRVLMKWLLSSWITVNYTDTILYPIFPS